jgi:hypothetical protein
MDNAVPSPLSHPHPLVVASELDPGLGLAARFSAFHASPGSTFR